MIRKRPWLVPAVLGVLVVVQAGPTVLWIRGVLAREGPSVAAAAPSEHGGAPATASAGADEGTAGRLESITGTGGREEPEARAPAPRERPEARAPAPREERRRPAPPPAGPPAIVAGLLAVDAPVPMQVLQRGRVIGTTEAETIMLAAGTHDLEFASEAVGYRVRRTVSVGAGRTTSLEVPAPSGTLHVNALPWAEIWIDGRPAGETPIGNLQAPIGTRELVFRHPELGERRTTVLVTLKEPARVSMDLRTP